MANESKKDFNAMLKNSKDMPKMQIIEDEKTIKKYGLSTLFCTIFIRTLFYIQLVLNN